MSFAWENENSSSKQTFHEKRMSIAKSIAQGTEILVVIGYSFPFFNREIDKEIFKAMKETVVKIYFQDPFNDGSNLKSQFDISPRYGIVPIKSTEQYFIPYEL